ncbi:MAG: sugar phosphate isomerase/epimerase, partial [Firmicutes bacterium]|nr:sugar phosphate isomerase/epimerase [Bacillota bacterium]
LYAANFSENYPEAIRDFGCGMEINHTCISECLDDKSGLIAEIRADIESTGADRLILHGPFTEIHPAGIDRRAREMGMSRLNEAYDIAAHFGIKKMVVHTGWMPFIYFKNWQAEKGAAFWQKFMKDKPEDFMVCVENVLEDEPYMLLDMMKQIEDPRIKLCLDIGHANAMTSQDIPAEKWIEVLSPHIAHFHLHNNDGTGDSHRPFGEGTMDMVNILKTIDSYCPADTTLTIEARQCLPCLQWLTEKGYI